MKIVAHCNQCMLDAFAASPHLSLGDLWPDIPSVLLDVEGDPGYRFECPKGHKNAFCLNVPQHELLFESGCLSLTRGAFREAVGSFAAARERFVEFCLKVEAEHSGVDPDVVELAWKHLASRSERQLGALVWAELLVQKRVQETARVAGDRDAFRNRVVHHGAFPTKEEAHSFARDLFQFIRERDAELNADKADARQRVLSRLWGHAAQQLWKEGHAGSVGGHGYATVLNGGASSFDEALEKFRELNPYARWHEDITVAEVASRLGVGVGELLTKLLVPTFFNQPDDAPVLPEEEAADEPPLSA